MSDAIVPQVGCSPVGRGPLTPVDTWFDGWTSIAQAPHSLQAEGSLGLGVRLGSGLA